MPVLMYHRIVEQEPLVDADGVCTSVARLEAHLAWLAAHSYLCVPLDLALHRAHKSEGRRFAITFDDGYAETLRLALPVLQKHSVPATVFVVSGMIGGDAVWNHRPARLLTHDELLELQSAGVFIGCHGRTHRRLSTLPRGEITSEVAGARDELQQMLGTPVPFFAYPHHDFDARVLTAVADAGFAGAAAGRTGVHGRYNLHRIDAARLSTWQLGLHVSGVHRWARRQKIPATVRRMVARLA